MRFFARSKWTGMIVFCGIAVALIAGSVFIPKLWKRTQLGYADAVGTMRQQAPPDQQVLHAWPNGTCPAGYVLEPNMFELGGRHWDGCYKPEAWIPHRNDQNGLMELHGSIDFLLHLEVMHTPVALTPRKRKSIPSHDE